VQDEIVLRDQLRTYPQSKLEILFQDDSTLTLAENSQITVDEQIVQPAAPSTSVFSLLRGKVRAAVTNRYQLPGARFELRTPTAVAGVRGTEFISSFDPAPDPAQDNSLVVGVIDQTRAESLAFLGLPVFLDPQFYTEILRNQRPTPPRLMDLLLFQSLIAATTITLPPPPGPVTSQQATQITGEVRNAQGVPVGDVEISVATMDGQTLAQTVTNAQGQYTLQGLAPGQYTITLNPRQTGVQGQTVVTSLELTGLVVNWTVSATAPAIATATAGGTSGGLFGLGTTGTFLGAAGLTGAGFGGAAASGSLGGGGSSGGSSIISPAQ
jgi:hypothetical protein